jgi:hypothetical protein|tara:strand:+ start:186 stop:341 length:156 start_codon:yes stop_codon:yes gene_type:complete
MEVGCLVDYNKDGARFRGEVIRVKDNVATVLNEETNEKKEIVVDDLVVINL